MISVQSKKRMDNIMTSLFLCGAGFAVVLLVAFVGFVIVEGFSGMTPEMLSCRRLQRHDAGNAVLYGKRHGQHVL